MNRPWYLDDLLASYECVSDNDVRICDFGDDSRQLKLRIRESWKSPRANSDSGADSVPTVGGAQSALALSLNTQASNFKSWDILQDASKWTSNYTPVLANIYL